jgi:hypothetical protein
MVESQQSVPSEEVQLIATKPFRDVPTRPAAEPRITSVPFPNLFPAGVHRRREYSRYRPANLGAGDTACPAPRPRRRLCGQSHLPRTRWQLCRADAAIRLDAVYVVGSITHSNIDKSHGDNVLTG